LIDGTAPRMLQHKKSSVDYRSGAKPTLGAWGGRKRDAETRVNPYVQEENKPEIHAYGYTIKALL